MGPKRRGCAFSSSSSSFPSIHVPGVGTIEITGILEKGAMDVVFEQCEELCDPMLKEANFYFDKIMMEAKEKLSKLDLEEDPEDWIKDARDTYENAVKGEWQAFRSEESPHMHKPLLDDFRAEFEGEIKLAINEHLNRIVSNNNKKECFNVMKKVVDKYAEWGSAVFDSFNQVMEKTMEGAPEEREQRQSIKSKPQKKKKSKSQKPAQAQVKETEQEQEAKRLEASSMEKQAPKPEEDDDDGLPELMEFVEEQVENQSTLGSVMSNEEKGVGQPSYNLKEKMLDMLKTMEEMKQRLTSVQNKQEQQGKFLMESLEEKMSNFRINQMKEIVTVMANFKKGGLKK